VDTPPYNLLSLYSGLLGLELGISHAIPINTVAYCEREISAIRTIIQRTREGLVDPGPIYTDVSTFPDSFPEPVDIICAGFPCTPWSWANTSENRGENDERNGWPDTIRIIRSLRPSYVFLENVPNLLNHRYFGTILGDLAQAGFNAEWDCFSGSDINAPQIRQRLFILAYPNSERLQRRSIRKLRLSNKCLPRQRSAPVDAPQLFPPPPDDLEGWAQVWKEMPDTTPGVCKLAPGISDRVGELQAYGNSVIPSMAKFAFETLSKRFIKED
jgi:DNA (cytosine-5)-methyltransferase 1